MPPERLAPSDPREWVNRAKSSLAHGRVRSDGVYLEDLCLNLQPAAEKAIKGVLLRQGIRFPHTHNIGDLLALLEGGGTEIPAAVRPSVRLTEYAVESRYPGPVEPVTEEEFLSALAVAEGVVDWAAGIVTLD
jgi:HEPN domain-containing protein